MSVFKIVNKVNKNIVNNSSNIMELPDSVVNVVRNGGTKINLDQIKDIEVNISNFIMDNGFKYNVRKLVVDLMEDMVKLYRIDSYELLSKNMDILDSIILQLDDVGESHDGTVYHLDRIQLNLNDGEHYMIDYQNDFDMNFTTYMKYYYNHLVLKELVPNYEPIVFDDLLDFYDRLYGSDEFNVGSNVILPNIGGIEFNHTSLKGRDKHDVIDKAIEYEVNHTQYIINEYIKNNDINGIDTDSDEFKVKLEAFITEVVFHIMDPEKYIQFTKDAYDFHLQMTYDGKLNTNGVFIYKNNLPKSKVKSSVNNGLLNPGDIITDFGSVVSVSDIYEYQIKVTFTRQNGKILIQGESAKFL